MTPAESETTFPRSAQGNSMVSLYTLTDELRRRRAVWIGFAVIGLVLALAFHVAVPKKYTATSSLNLIQPATSTDQTTDMANDIAWLGTSEVADNALKALHLPMTTQAFQRTYHGTAVTNNILRLSVTAPSPSAAIARNAQVAQAFIAYRAEQYRDQYSSSASAIQPQIDTLKAQNVTLGNTIAQLSSYGQGASSTEVANLTTQQTANTSQISQLQSQLQADYQQMATVNGDDKVINPPMVTQKSAKKVLAEDGATGLVGGLCLGIGVVVVAALLSQSVRRREDVARALGSPVELSIKGFRSRRILRKRRLRWRLKHPDRDLLMAVLYLRKQLYSQDRPSLVVVSLNADDAAALAVAYLAQTLATEGEAVVVADLARDRPLSVLFGANWPTGVTPFDAVGHHPTARGKGNGNGKDPIDALLVLASLDPALGAGHLADFGRDAVMITRAGHVSAAGISAAADMLRYAGVTIRSSILVGSDSRDESSGLMDIPAPSTSSEVVSGAAPKGADKPEVNKPVPIDGSSGPRDKARPGSAPAGGAPPEESHDWFDVGRGSRGSVSFGVEQRKGL